MSTRSCHIPCTRRRSTSPWRMSDSRLSCSGSCSGRRALREWWSLVPALNLIGLSRLAARPWWWLPAFFAPALVLLACGPIILTSRHVAPTHSPRISTLRGCCIRRCGNRWIHRVLDDHPWPNRDKLLPQALIRIRPVLPSLDLLSDPWLQHHRLDHVTAEVDSKLANGRSRPAMKSRVRIHAIAGD